MPTVSSILVSIVFVCAVAGLVYALTLRTKKDADRWLVNRRVTDRRRPAGASHEPERRTGERRAPEDLGQGA